MASDSTNSHPCSITNFIDVSPYETWKKGVDPGKPIIEEKGIRVLQVDVANQRILEIYYFVKPTNPEGQEYPRKHKSRTQQLETKLPGINSLNFNGDVTFDREFDSRTTVVRFCGENFKNQNVKKEGEDQVTQCLEEECLNPGELRRDQKFKTLRYTKFEKPTEPLNTIATLIENEHGTEEEDQAPSLKIWSCSYKFKKSVGRRVWEKKGLVLEQLNKRERGYIGEDVTEICFFALGFERHPSQNRSGHGLDGIFFHAEKKLIFFTESKFRKEYVSAANYMKNDLTDAKVEERLEKSAQGGRYVEFAEWLFKSNELSGLWKLVQRVLSNGSIESFKEEFKSLESLTEIARKLGFDTAHKVPGHKNDIVEAINSRAAGKFSVKLTPLQDQTTEKDQTDIREVPSTPDTPPKKSQDLTVEQNLKLDYSKVNGKVPLTPDAPAKKSRKS